MIKLKVISGRAPKSEYNLNEGEYYLGRKEDCHIFLDSVRVSRKHAKITVEGTSINIEDLNSSNGTIVNGDKIRQTSLKENDKIFIGEFIFRVMTDSGNEFGGGLASDISSPSFSPINDSIGDEQSTPSKIEIASFSSPKETEDSLRVSPLIKIARHFNLLEWKYKIIIAIVLYTAFTYKFTQDQIIASQSKGIFLDSKDRAIALVKYLAEKSKDQLLANNDLLLDIDEVLKEKGVTDVIIADSYGRIRAPLSKINIQLTDQVSQNALIEGRISDNFPNEEQIRKYLKDGNSAISFTVACPIRVWDTNEGTFKQLGIAEISFSPSEITSRIVSIKELKMKGLLATIIPGGVLFILIYFITVLPIRKVKENIASLMSDNSSSFKIPHSFIELADLIESIKILLSNAQYKEGQMSQDGKTEVSELKIGKENIDDILGVISDGIIITNKNSKIEVVNDSAVSLLRLPISGGIGQHILEVLPDKEILSIVNSLLNNVTKSKEKEHSEEIEFGGPGKKLTVRARALRERFGEINAIAISFRHEIT